jgi:hypothetical protein
VRKAPKGKRTSDLASATPAAVTASAISRLPIEPNNLPSSPALEAITTASNAVNFSARTVAAAN